jgi:hypothetical protein
MVATANPRDAADAVALTRTVTASRREITGASSGSNSPSPSCPSQARPLPAETRTLDPAATSTSSRPASRSSLAAMWPRRTTSPETVVTARSSMSGCRAAKASAYASSTSVPMSESRKRLTGNVQPALLSVLDEVLAEVRIPRVRHETMLGESSISNATGLWGGEDRTRSGPKADRQPLTRTVSSPERSRYPQSACPGRLRNLKAYGDDQLAVRSRRWRR